MAYQKKTWQEKLEDDKDLPKVEVVSDAAAKRMGGRTLVIPRPRDVDRVMRSVRKGKLITINDLRQTLAEEFGADIGCPICCGIFAIIVARAAEERREQGAKRVTPWWRTLKKGLELNPKFPGGVARQRALLEAEGHVVTARGKRVFVVT